MNPIKLTDEAIGTLLEKIEHMLRSGKVVVVLSSPTEELKVTLLTYASDKATDILLSQALMMTQTGTYETERILDVDLVHKKEEVN